MSASQNWTWSESPSLKHCFAFSFGIVFPLAVFDLCVSTTLLFKSNLYLFFISSSDSTWRLQRQTNLTTQEDPGEND